MSYDYSKLATTAKSLIGRFGKPVSVRRFAATGDAANPTLTPTDNSFTGVVLNYMRDQIDGTLIQHSDRKLLVAASGAPIVPSVNDRAVIEGNDFAILAVKALEPGPTTILWELQIRGA